jgi:hypothetical protein
MASRKQQRERLRAERLAAEQSAGSSTRTRMLAGYFVAGLLTLAVLAGLVVVLTKGGGSANGGTDACANAHVNADFGSVDGLEFDCRKGTPPPERKQGDLVLAAREAGCTLRQDLPDEGNTHVPNSQAVTYRTNPPTSGNHNPNPVADGAYTTPLRTNPDTGNQMNIRNLVHAMEHGRIEIQYASKLPEPDQLALKGVFDEDPPAMVMFPNNDMPYQVAATAWRQLLGCPAYNERVLDAIRAFRDTYRGQGPEPFALTSS